MHHLGVVIDDLVFGEEIALVDHQGPPVPVAVEAEFQYRQAGFRGDSGQHPVVEREAVCAEPILVVDEQCRQAAQARQPIAVEAPERGQFLRARPQRIGNRVACQDAPLTPASQPPYQMLTRSSGGRYMPSPGFTPKASWNTSWLRAAPLARKGAGLCGSVSS